ncbi:hypothetical protein [Conexibacter arvalis]|uniref:LppX_LprAFG lipoprotein n=1 Tax=Conexibacter arvalis TaxID=912552 RepID=A0A840ICQ3_9ACTN|nr:hypothetical protein [Conexibacter arvalis]MBB4662649.1 hypothetical protein [Conexibacter arvalis]
MTHRAPQHRARAIVALLLAAIAALTLAACGGDDDGGSGGGGDSADARTLLNDTFTGTKDVRSGRISLSLAVDAGGQAFSLGLAGPFENVGDDAYPKFDLSIDARLGAQGSFTAGAVSTSDRLFLEVEGNAYELPAELLESAQRSRDPAGRLSIPDLDPQSWIDDPEVAGEESVGGAETYHITGEVNVAALLDSIDRVLAEADRQGLSGVTGGEVPRSLPADTRADIEEAVRSAEVDVWTGKDDKTLRKLQVDLVVEPRDDRRGTVSFVLELADLNEPQSIAAPDRTRPFDELLAGLGALLGSSGLDGLGGADSGSATPEGAGDYARCIADAGADVEKAQECSRLLGG